MINGNSRTLAVVVGVLIGFLLMASPAGAFEVKLAFVGPSGDYSGEYFMNGFWVVYSENYASNTYFTEIINASSGKTVLALNDFVAHVVPVGNKYLLVSTGKNEYYLRLYRNEGGTYTLVWNIDVTKYGWVSYILPVPEKNLILVGTVDVSQDDFGGHYVLGVDFSGKIKFATNLHVVGQAVSAIIPTGNGKYLAIVPGLGGGTPYFGLINESGNIVRSLRMWYPVTAATVYIQKRYIMVAWQNKSEGKMSEIKTYYGVWTLNLTPVATFKLPYRFLEAIPIFANDSLYLFTVKNSGLTCTLMESRYLQNGTLVWSRVVQKTKLANLSKFGISLDTVASVLLPYPNVGVIVYPCGDRANIVAVDFTTAVPLENSSVKMSLDRDDSAYVLDIPYNSPQYIISKSRVYLINSTLIPSALFVNSSPPATVYIDGYKAGRTPLYTYIGPGQHNVVLFHQNYSIVKRILVVGHHEGIRIFARLRPLNATVYLNSTPTAEVDIMPLGLVVYTPTKVSLRNGTYTFFFTSKKYPRQYELVEKTVTLLPNETTSINVRLTLTKSELVIRSNVKNATVYVDGKKMGTTPLNVSVALGSHNVTVEAEGYVAKSITINATKPVINVFANLSPVATNSSPTQTTVHTTYTTTTSSTNTTVSNTVRNSSTPASHSICGPGLIVLLTIVAIITRKAVGARR